MKPLIFLGIAAAAVFVSFCSGQAVTQPTKGEPETRYLAFQIFTYGPNPKVPTMGEGTNPQPARFPDKAVLREYIVRDR